MLDFRQLRWKPTAYPDAGFDRGGTFTQASGCHAPGGGGGGFIHIKLGSKATNSFGGMSMFSWRVANPHASCNVLRSQISRDFMHGET